MTHPSNHHHKPLLALPNVKDVAAAEVDSKSEEEKMIGQSVTAAKGGEGLGEACAVGSTHTPPTNGPTLPSLCH